MKINKNHNIFHYLVTVIVFFVKGLIDEVVWLLAGLGGYLIFQTRKSPYDLVIGLPLILISLSFVVNSMWSEVLALFSPTYNRGVCVLCDK